MQDSSGIQMTSHGPQHDGLLQASAAQSQFMGSFVGALPSGGSHAS